MKEVLTRRYRQGGCQSGAVTRGAPARQVPQPACPRTHGRQASQRVASKSEEIGKGLAEYERMVPRSQDPSVQVTPLKVGLLLGFEPWDYDRGKHLWPIPVRFLLGWHAVDLINTYFSPSLLAGASVTLPLIESPSQLNTSLALGAF